MKKNDLAEIKKMEIKAIDQKVKALKIELNNLHLQKNVSKVNSFADLRKKQVDIAQMLTIKRQKQLLAELESTDAKAMADKGEKDAKE